MRRVLPRGWHEHRLADVARVVGGFAFANAYQGGKDLDIPFFKVSDMNQPTNLRVLGSAKNTVSLETLRRLKARSYPAGTVVFPKVGAALLTNKRRILGREACFDNNIMGLIPEGCDSHFLSYLMQTIDFADHVQPGALPSVNGTAVGNITAPFPPLPEQRKIAAILSSVDDAIEKTQAVIDQVQVVKKGLIQELLTRGLPGRHKTFKQTEIGEVPAEWKVTTLGQHLREPIRNGYSPTCPSKPTGAWILHLGAVTFDGYDPTAVKPAPPKNGRIRSSLLAPGDLLVSRSNTPDRVGLAGIYDGRPANCSYPDLLMRVRPDEVLDVHFLQLYLLSSKGRRFFRRSARGTSGSMVKINGDLLRGFPLPVPALVEQKEIVSRVGAVTAATEAQRRNCVQLSSLKSALMSVLLTGEVRITSDSEEA